MTKTEFERVQSRYRTSGKSLKNFLREMGISYTTYHYWRNKLDAEKRDHSMAPISIREPQGSNAENTMAVLVRDGRTGRQRNGSSQK